MPHKTSHARTDKRHEAAVEKFWYAVVRAYLDFVEETEIRPKKRKAKR